MKLPNAEQITIIPADKLEGYCLNLEHRVGGHKARMFRAIGYTLENASALRAILLDAAHEADNVTLGKLDKYGQRYNFEFTLNAVTVLTAWIVDPGQTVPRFLSAYPI